MKRRLVTSLAIALMLIATLTLPAVAEVLSPAITASVTVNSDINVTVIDNGDPGIVFGALDAGTTDNPDTTATGDGSVTLSVSGTSIVDLNVSGTDFDTGLGATFPVSYAKFNTSNSTSGATSMSTGALLIDSGVDPGTDVDVWFWIDVPAAGVTAGSYTSTFTFEAID